MKKCLTPEQIEQTLALAKRVSSRILDFYQSDYAIDIKIDNSPVTQADLVASQLLEKELPIIAPYPVLSEENTPNTPDWLDWETYWLIDPIDGTKHFINATGDFCTCIALIHQNQAVFGLIYAPTTDMAWFAQTGDEFVSKYQHNQIKLLDNVATPIALSVALSCNHISDRMKQLLSVLGDYNWHGRGSALKYIDIIEGKASIYPKMWDTCEWDSAAGQCLLECAGGQVIHFETGKSLQYGHKTSLINPHFLAYRYLTDEQVSILLNRYQTIAHLG